MKELNFQKRKRMKRLLGSRLTIAVLVVLVVVLTRATWNVSQKEKETASMLTDIGGRQDDLIEQRTFLTAEIERLQTERGVEEEVREKYGLARTDEHVIILVDSDTSTTTTQKQNGFWSRVKGWFSQ